MRSDLYGGSFIFHGHVQGMSAGTGAAFSLLPAQNASGNWIKVVQRVPVRIQIDDERSRQIAAARGPVRHRDGGYDQRATVRCWRWSPTDKPVGDTQVYAQDLDKANAEADAVVRRNLGAAH